MSKIKTFFFILVVIAPLIFGATKVSAQLEQGVVRTIVGEFIGEDPGPDPGPGPEGFTFFCQYGKVDETGAMAPGGERFWNQSGCNIYGSGCNPTAIAMIVSSFNKRYTPIEIALGNNRLGCSGSSGLDDGVKRWLENRGFTISGSLRNGDDINLEGGAGVESFLNNNYYVWACAKVQYVDQGGYSGRFTDHCFVITDIDANKNLQVMDPTFCRLSYTGGRRILEDVNNGNLSGRRNVKKWNAVYAIKLLNP